MKYNEIPPKLFLFKSIQDFEGYKDKSKMRRYELFNIEQYPFSELLILSYNIFKKDLHFEGYAPIEMAIELVKKGTECLDSTINLTLTKKNFKKTFILELAKFVDTLDLEVSWFILWTDTVKSKQKNVNRNVSGTVRQNVFMRDNYTCQICGATVKDGAKLELDHIVPVSKGGTNDENNLQVLCQRCNREKHNRDDLLHDKRKLIELNGADEFEDICEDILGEMHWYEKETGEEEIPMEYLRNEMIEIKNEDALSFERSIELLIKKRVCHYSKSHKIKMGGNYHDMLNLVKLEGK